MKLSIKMSKYKIFLLTMRIRQYILETGFILIKKQFQPTVSKKN